ncbi:DUF4129 domain-containing protein [Micromonospora sp. HM5-17]|uniref:DUF4129 domain-containing protein n=1 Tax=Micromonospora sp. HM5-17 TaxID=2487710 RepID=UPI0018F71533|nr:DUF4129 domain-containing protein [Micromonospora sp. HM5-17]
MSPSRWWAETVAALGDVVPLPLAALLLVLAALLVGLGWYYFPAWVPRRPPRWRLSRRRRPQSQPYPPAETTTEPGAGTTTEAPEPSDVPAAVRLMRADRLAGDGRYAEAVRERLRGMIRSLVDHHVLAHQPGMTVTEVASAAARNRPEVGPTLRAAGQIFSDLWYGQRPARPEHDARMRDLAADLDRLIADHTAHPDAQPAGRAAHPSLVPTGSPPVPDPIPTGSSTESAPVPAGGPPDPDPILAGPPPATGTEGDRR